MLPPPYMASKSILLLATFLVVATKVFSYDGDLKIVVNYASPQVPAAPPPVKSPTPSPSVKSPPYSPPVSTPPVKAPPVLTPPVKAPPVLTPPVKAPPVSTPPVKAPPISTPPVKAPPVSTPPVKAPPVSTPPVKAPPVQPPYVKPPIATPPVKGPPSQPPVVHPPPPLVAPSPPASIVKSKKDCIPLCDYRCKLHSRKRLCARACMTCCDRCKCVPPGTYGNREKCGKCYTDMLTHGNKYKCP